MPGTACPAKQGSKRMQNNSKRLRGILAVAVLAAASAGLSVAQEVVQNNRKALKMVAVQYPSVLKSRGIGGTVKLRVQISANGTVKDVQVLGGNPILSECSVKAMKQWLFVAAEKDETVEMAVVFDPSLN
jgi:TonB family protein